MHSDANDSSNPSMANFALQYSECIGNPTTPAIEFRYITWPCCCCLKTGITPLRRFNDAKKLDSKQEVKRTLLASSAKPMHASSMRQTAKETLGYQVFLCIEFDDIFTVPLLSAGGR